MKCIYFLSMVLAAAIAQEKYVTKLDNFSIENVVADKTQVKTFLDCFNDDGPCEGPAAELKKNARDAINLSCTKCTDEQKHIAKMLLIAFPGLPDEYEKFKKTYDPKGDLLPALAAATANY